MDRTNTKIYKELRVEAVDGKREVVKATKRGKVSITEFDANQLNAEWEKTGLYYEAAKAAPKAKEAPKEDAKEEPKK